MKKYQPSNFEVGRGVFYRIIEDFILLVFLPSNTIGFFFKVRILGTKYIEYTLWFWLVTIFLMLFFGFRKIDVRRAFLIEADEQGVRLQYYRGKLYFFQKLININLRWQDIERINNCRSWAGTQIGLFALVYNILFIHMKDRECYTIEIDYCSTLMKKIDKELNEMLLQYGEPKGEK